MNEIERILQIPDSECACNKCKSMCRISCLGSIVCIRRLIANGYGDRLMIFCDFYKDTHGKKHWVNLLMPAQKGYESVQDAPYCNPVGRGCTFQKHNGLCAIHEIKPLQGKKACCTKGDQGMKKAIFEHWDCDEGRELVDSWKKEYGKNHPDPSKARVNKASMKIDFPWCEEDDD